MQLIQVPYVEASQPAWTWSWTDVWIAGVLMRLVWLGIGMTQLFRMRKQAQRIDPPIAAYSCKVAWYGSAHGPATFGRTILLPKSVLALEPATLEAIARHELRHVERRDWLWVTAEELLRAALWFHPAIWWALRRIHLTREQVIDREVVSATGDRTSYLEALVAVAAHRRRLSYAPVPTFLSKGQLAQRVAVVLKETPMSKKILALRLSSAFAMMLALVMAMAFAWPFEAQANLVPIWNLALNPAPAKPSVSVQQLPAARPRPKPTGERANLAQAPQREPAPVPTAPTGPVRISPETARNMVLTRVNPVYPAIAKTARVQGDVRLNVTFDEQGRVNAVSIIEGPALLREASMDAVRQWVFQPMAVNGVPTSAITEVTIQFSLQ
jgi:TonB family protein